MGEREREDASVPWEGFRLAMDGSSLIPGLPNELAMECLLRTSRFTQTTSMPLVCKGWRSLLTSRLIYKLREEAGIAEEYLYVRTEGGVDGKGRWKAFDSQAAKWRTIKEMPGVPSGVDLVDFASVVIGTRLLVIGGTYMNCRREAVRYKLESVSHLLGATREVRAYDAVSNLWENLAPMHKSRCNFSCGMLPDGRIYVAGGYAKQDMDDAECYDPKSDTWHQLPPMTATHWRSITGVFGNRFCVIGGRIGGTARSFRTNQKVKADVWNPDKHLWLSQNLWLESEVCLRQVVSHGGVLVAADLQRQKLCIVEVRENGDYHLEVIGAIPAPEGLIRLNFKIVSFLGELWVVGGTLTSLPYVETTPYSVAVDFSLHKNTLTADCCGTLLESTGVKSSSNATHYCMRSIAMEDLAGRVSGCVAIAI